MLIEIHIIKNYPPVNLNRDDSGAPKSCFFGGVQRSRISSQCLKRSWRTSELFKSLNSFGIRTRHMPTQVGEKLKAAGVADDIADAAVKKLSGIANKDGKENSKGNYTTQIVFYSNEEIERITEAVKAVIDKDKTLDKFSKRTPKDFEQLKSCAVDKPITADIALFGRMVTSEYFADVEASMQVAHAISTHGVNRESDYFTAVDDLLENDSEANVAGMTGMIGDVDFNSSCYYEYASIDTDILEDNLKNMSDEDRGELIKKLIPLLIRVMCFTNPSGKQNSFAGQILPDMVMIECKKDKIPLSYVNAFEEPVATWSTRPNVVKNSIEAFVKHVNCMDAAYELPVVHRAYFAPRFSGINPESCMQFEKLSELTQNCATWIEEDERS